jgi:hypothetical protein
MKMSIEAQSKVTMGSTFIGVSAVGRGMANN